MEIITAESKHVDIQHLHKVSFKHSDTSAYCHRVLLPSAHRGHVSQACDVQEIQATKVAEHKMIDYSLVNYNVVREFSDAYRSVNVAAVLHE